MRCRCACRKRGRGSAQDRFNSVSASRSIAVGDAAWQGPEIGEKQHGRPTCFFELVSEPVKIWTPKSVRRTGQYSLQAAREGKRLFWPQNQGSVAALTTRSAKRTAKASMADLRSTTPNRCGVRQLHRLKYLRNAHIAVRNANMIPRARSIVIRTQSFSTAPAAWTRRAMHDVEKDHSR